MAATSCRKADLCERRDNDMIQERFVLTQMQFALGKNGGYNIMVSSLGGRLISVGSQAGSE